MPELNITKAEILPLALLTASGGEVNGRTRLQKLAFLLQEEELQQDAYNFIKYDYGPFSKELLDDLEDLEDKGVLKINKTRTFSGNKRYDYSVDSGAEEFLEVLAQANDDVEQITESAERVVRQYGDMSVREIVEHVYDKYPEYKENSVYQY